MIRSALVHISNFIGYRISNFGYRFVYFALDLDTIHHYSPEVEKRYKEEDPYDEKRVTYPLNENSFVIDIGGFTGDWASRIFCRYGCFVDVYEPHPELSEKCARLFYGNSKVHTFAYALSDVDATMNFYGDNMLGSLFKHSTGKSHIVPVHRTATIFKEKYNAREIDLLKINAEGAEYAIIQDLLDNWDIRRIKNIQIQFHVQVPESEKLMKELQYRLSITHKKTWGYDLIFENWQRKE